MRLELGAQLESPGAVLRRGERTTSYMQVDAAIILKPGRIVLLRELLRSIG
jgi:hypothetical protein